MELPIDFMMSQMETETGESAVCSHLCFISSSKRVVMFERKIIHLWVHTVYLIALFLSSCSYILCIQRLCVSLLSVCVFQVRNISHVYVLVCFWQRCAFCHHILCVWLMEDCCQEMDLGSFLSLKCWGFHINIPSVSMRVYFWRGAGVCVSVFVHALQIMVQFVGCIWGEDIKGMSFTPFQWENLSLSLTLELFVFWVCERIFKIKPVMYICHRVWVWACLACWQRHPSYFCLFV